MRAFRMQSTASISVVVGMAIALLFTLAGYFRSVEKNSVSGVSETRILNQLRAFHDHLKTAEDPEEAKRSLRTFEGLSGFGPDSEAMRVVKKAYAGTLATFANKPKEADDRYLLSKKRELMESLVNVYRKEIPHGDIRIRAIYLNILFDTQSSLLNENRESEEVYIRRNKERLASLRALVPASDQGLQFRVSSVEGILQGFERGFTQSAAWEKEKTDGLAKAEKNLSQIAREVFQSQDQTTEDFRRSFLYACILSLIVVLGSGLALFSSHKLARLKFESRADSFVTFLKEFGRDRADPTVAKAEEALTNDADWAAVLQRAKVAEEQFVIEYQNLLAVPRSLQIPYIVFAKDRVARLWNQASADLFGLADGQDRAIDDLIADGRVRAREGDTDTLIDTIRASFSVPQADTFEFLFKNGETWVPVELIASPIVTGRAAGGKIFCFREIRNEAERIDRRVTAQLAGVRDFVHKITHFYPSELSPREEDATAVKDMISDLNVMKQKIDEREILWKSETSALVDQVVRQREILERLGGELAAIRQGHGKALELLRNVHECDENFIDEVSLMERDVERWRANRRRLLADLERHEEIVRNAGNYERGLRETAERLRHFLEQYEREHSGLTEFAEKAKLQAVNLAMGTDPAQWEYGDKARAFSETLQKFIGKTSTLLAKVNEFVRSHPGTALAPHLDAADLDDALLKQIEEEQEVLAGFFKRWKETGGDLVSEGEKALGLLRSAEKQGELAIQLSETSLLINDQAKGNLSRWN